MKSQLQHRLRRLNVLSNGERWSCTTGFTREPRRSLPLIALTCWLLSKINQLCLFWLHRNVRFVFTHLFVWLIFMVAIVRSHSILLYICIYLCKTFTITFLCYIKIIMLKIYTCIFNFLSLLWGLVLIKYNFSITLLLHLVRQVYVFKLGSES